MNCYLSRAPDPILLPLFPLPNVEIPQKEQEIHASTITPKYEFCEVPIFPLHLRSTFPAESN
jgi:hypothetical protein